MGKKSHKKPNKPPMAKEQSGKKLSAQRRNELNSLIDDLLKHGAHKATNVTDQWKQYVEMRTVLERIQAVESVLRTKSPGLKNRPALIETFYKWANECGASYDGVKVSEFPGYDLGLEATKNFKRGDVLMTIPRKMIMCEETMESFVDALVAEIPITESMSNVKLAFALILEKLNPNSFWKPYLDLLPDKHATVMYFTVNEMQELKGSNALPQALDHCKSIACQYAFVRKCLSRIRMDKYENHPTAGAVFELLKEKLTFDLYCWAISIVMTRQNEMPRTKEDAERRDDDAAANGCNSMSIFIPFWDFANHKNGEITSAYNFKTDQLESTSLTDYIKGEQIFIYYGNRSNAVFLIHNGFVYPDNTNDYVSIRLGLSNSDELIKERTELLGQLNIPKNCELKVLPSPDFISPELLAFVRVFNMNREQLIHWITSERANDLLHIDCALETLLESKTWIFLQTRLNLLLKVFPTTLDDDDVALANHNKGQMKLGYIKAMLLQYRILEKIILVNALDYAKQRTKA